MLFDIAWPELLLIGVIALVVIGPKDLPRAMRVAGFWLRKARTLSREFQNSVDQMIREAELEEVREELKKASQLDLENQIRSTVDPTGELAESIRPPAVPDFFTEAEGPSPVAAATPLATETPPAPALAAPAEAPLAEPPEQPDLPFATPLPPAAESAAGQAAAAAPPERR